MIGLKRNTVFLKEHDPAWIKTARDLCDEILNTAGDLIEDVQHIGSTSIQGIPAKPILDLVIAISDNNQINRLIDHLAVLHYIYRGDWGENGGHLMVQESKPGIRTVHLHIVNIADFQWKNYIKFRDTLKNDVEKKTAYANLKRSIATQYQDNRIAYTEAKNSFIRSILN